jgi:hypothetical protein
LGHTGYYRKFDKNYACITTPLTYFLKKNSFAWNEEATFAFTYLKDVMTSTLVLKTPNFGKASTIECDASLQGIRVVLMQEGGTIGF